MGLTLSTDYRNTSETSSIISYSASFSSQVPTGVTATYSGNIGGVSVNLQSGTVTITDLSTGDANTITGSITRSYTVKGVTTENTVNGEVIVYTHPGAFLFNATSDPSDVDTTKKNIIHQVFNKTKIKEWIAHYKNAYKWLKQDDVNYGGKIVEREINEEKIKITYPSIDNLAVENNDIITASWYNGCIAAMSEFNVEEANVTLRSNFGYVQAEDLIHAYHANNLRFEGKPKIKES